jgi:hypothetical protein
MSTNNIASMERDDANSESNNIASMEYGDADSTSNHSLSPSTPSDDIPENSVKPDLVEISPSPSNLDESDIYNNTSHSRLHIN